MFQALTALAALNALLRSVFLVGGVALAVIATADWAVRTRRLNPFGGVARFMRTRVDPRLVGVERQVLRAGGRTTTTPWWALVLYAVLALLVLAALDMIGALVRQAALATSLGGMGILLLLVRWTFGFLTFALLVRVLASWLPRLGASRWIRWSYGATEWMLRPLRNLLPSIGGVIDITPIVAYFALQLVQWLVESILLRAVS
ncbi:MAG: YggT family protein [Gemmatimonadetes bacterium]|nr:YggT family protein [Gemmatimonadota bacterium]